MQILVAATTAPERDCCSQLALLSLDPLLQLLLRTPAHRPAVSRILARVTQYPKAQPRLGEDPRAGLLLTSLTAVLADNASDRETCEACVRIVCNAAMCFANHTALLAAGVIALARPLLAHQSPAVRFQACKALLLLGETDVGGVELYGLVAQVPLELVPASNPEEESEWARIKAAPIETVVCSGIDLGFNLSITSFSHCMASWRHFWEMLCGVLSFLDPTDWRHV